MEFKRLIKKSLLSVIIFVLIFPVLSFVDFKSENKIPQNRDKKVSANSIFTATSANLLVGTNTATSSTNTGGVGATFGADDNKWVVNRVAAVPSLDIQLNFDGVDLFGGNKLIITLEDTNITTGTTYYHQICDWVSTTSVDNAADANCTGGGWRTLHPRKTTFTNTADTSRGYEIYDGYFSTRTVAPGTVISTPLSNFVESTNKRVLVRFYSAVSATTQFAIDAAQIETAIDPYYEPADIVTTNATHTNFISDTVGPLTSTNITGADNTRITHAMVNASTPLDLYYSFKNVRTFTGANTIIINSEMLVSNVALTLGIYLYNFQTTTWTQVGTNFSMTTGDVLYAFAFNSYEIGGFNIADYISGTNEVRFRILSNSPGTAYNTQIDYLYMSLGAVNSDDTLCEISWGTGTATNCSNTRRITGNRTSAPATSTWQATAVLEMPATSFYPLDNDNDGTAAEYAASQNLSFNVTVDPSMAVTAVHYSAKYRSNSTAQTADLQMRDYSALGTSGGWINTPGTDTNALTTYSYFDTWGLAEYITAVDNTINTGTNLMNLRLRTSAGSTTNPGTRDWAFAMISIRWVEESARNTLTSKHTPNGGLLAVGSETATSTTNAASWRGTLGVESNTNGSSRYWTTARTASGLDQQLYFDQIELFGANKFIFTVKDSNITTGNAYVHQICDWVSSTGVNNAADANCLGGGWRTLNQRLDNHTNTSDTTRTHEVYNGYFSNRVTSPGTVYDTPLSNFVNTSNNNRVLFRTFSTVNSTVQYRLDFVQLEVAIDSVYEPAEFTKIGSFAGATTNFISEVRGTAASDAQKFTIANTVANSLDVYFSYKNVKTYTGANTIVFKPEVCISNVALTFNLHIYNFSTTSWTQLNGASITGSACTTDTAYAYALNNVNLSDYIDNSEIRVRINTSTSNTNTLQIDRAYLIIGSTNTDTSLCQISWGTGTPTDCANTRNVDSAETGSTATSTWQNTSVLEYVTNYNSADNDDDATNAEAAFAANLSVPATLSSGMSVSAIHYAARFRSNVSTLTVSQSILDYGGKFGTSGWTNVGATNAATTYTWSDSWQSAELQSSAYQYIDSVNGRMNVRLRTTASTAVAAGTVWDWDFAMISLRWLQVVTGTLYADIVDSVGDSVANPSISFGLKTTSFECQDSTAIFGTTSEKIRIFNNTNVAAWSLSLAATSGATSAWDDSGTQYDFNDSAGAPAGCSDGGDADSRPGQMSLDFSGATITPQSGCTNTGITLGSNSSFIQGTQNSIDIAQASGSADTNCYWDITGIVVNQKIPPDQASGTYNISMALTVLSN